MDWSLDEAAARRESGGGVDAAQGGRPEGETPASAEFAAGERDGTWGSPAEEATGGVDWTVLLGGRRQMEVEDGVTLRLLSAMEVLEARREAEELCQEGRERAICSNSCLLARALERDGKALFDGGEAVLRGLSVEAIGTLARRWSGFSRRENPSPTDEEERVESLKKAWSTRLIRAFSGVCSWLLGRFPPRRGPGR